MKLPDGVWFHGNGLRLGPGDDLPDEIVATLPPDHPLKAPRTETTAATARPARSKDT